VSAKHQPGNFDIFFTRSTDGGQNFSALLNVSNSPAPPERLESPLTSWQHQRAVGDNVPPATNTHIYFARSSNGGLHSRAKQCFKRRSISPIRGWQ